MDRLICGDVGFGKTEIAIRAAFKAVTDNKQVAVLVPTTILALQHYNTFKARLKDFPCNIDYINRFKSAKQQTETLKEMEEGKINIIIGTHRLLGKDVKFKDLGLMVIDEEQKFGVAAKDKLKAIRVNVDTLTLTATPIPRTLQFSMMGARDLSIINTPPPNRQPVTTELHLFSEKIIRDAVSYELNRNGQVFFVHNRVSDIHEIAGMIQRLCPGAKVSVGHGQMDGDALEEIMMRFIDGESDVLVATTIIEAGLDIPNANTIIINQAHLFGLSDLHQMRGRVGRSNKKAFCYLLSPALVLLPALSRKRLQTISEFSDLGSGFNIAMRDLDIRGAGNLLGGEQSGFINEIGFDMYHKILDEAIQELKETTYKDLYSGAPVEIKNPNPMSPFTHDFVKDCQIDTDMEILIPDAYVNSISERLSLYKDLDNIEEEAKLTVFEKDLKDRFGPVPAPVIQLINTIRLRWLAKALGFEKIILKNNRMKGYFITNQQSPFYQGAVFTYILQYIQEHPKTCKMKEEKNKLTLTFESINTTDNAIAALKRFLLPQPVNP
jgi:transcription-repair coupling factor (superfamily II helicase)